MTVPEELQDHLLNLFWRWQNAWQYVVHKQTFLQDRHNGIAARYHSPLLLSAILALSSRYSDRPETRTHPNDANTAGDLYQRRAKLMLHYECEAPTTSTVQAAVLIALREFAVNKEASAWLYMGM